MTYMEGKQLGNYRLINLLGSGNTGKVYLGEHIHYHNNVAIKVFDAPCYDAEQFDNAARTLTRLVHPHIVRILDNGVESRQAFLIMNYISNGNLRQHHPKGQIIPLTTIISYVKQITDALQYIHHEKVLHLNIKPENILINSENEVFLTEAGILAMMDQVWGEAWKEREQTQNFFEYKALDRFDNPHSDQYALGIVVYEWLCGDVPFKGHGIEILMQHALTSPPYLHEKVGSIPFALEEVVMKALAKDPEQRFESIQAFANALERAYLSSIRSKTPDRVGQQFGNYRLVRLLGHGGFADVFLGQHRRLKTYAAIKVLHTHLSDEDIEGFQKEAQTIANLKHPCIIRILDFDVEGGIPFLVMDYAPNGSLRQRHPKGNRLPLTTVVSYVKQVAHALQHAHDQKLIHRDIKPENILLGENNEVLLSDFGIAVVAHSSRSMKIENQAGTVYYMAPEQIQGKPRKATDQYALGIVVYEWLSGSRPFKGTYMEIVTQHLTVPPSPLHEKNLAIPPAVEQVVMIALAKDPHERFASVQAFANALEQASQQ